MLLPVSGAAPFPNHADVASEESFAAVFEAQTPQIAPPFMGLPGVSVATSGTDAPPIGAQLLAGPWREDLLLDAAADIAARGPRIGPVDPRP
jgi:amidase